MVKATDGVYKYVEGGFAVKHKKYNFKVVLYINYLRYRKFSGVDYYV